MITKYLFISAETWQRIKTHRITKQLPSSGADIQAIRDVGKKYPKFKPFTDRFEKDPDGIMSDDAKKEFMRMLGDKKNFIN